MERTQEEVIKIFEEKQQNAEQSVNALKGIKSKEREQRQLIGEVFAYEDCIAFLRGCSIVESHPKGETLKPKADITKDKLEGVWVLYSGVITEKDGNVYIDDGTKVYCFPKYSTTRDKDLKYYYQEKKPSEIVGADMPKSCLDCEYYKQCEEQCKDIKKLSEANKPNNSYKYVEELLNDNLKLQNELSQCKGTIVELANEVTTYRKVAREREV